MTRYAKKLLRLCASSFLSYIFQMCIVVLFWYKATLALWRDTAVVYSSVVSVMQYNFIYLQGLRSVTDKCSDVFRVLKRYFDFLFFRLKKKARYMVFAVWLIVLSLGLIALFFRDEITDPETGNICLIYVDRNNKLKVCFLPISLFLVRSSKYSNWNAGKTLALVRSSAP